MDEYPQQDPPEQTPPEPPAQPAPPAPEPTAQQAYEPAPVYPTAPPPVYGQAQQPPQYAQQAPQYAPPGQPPQPPQYAPPQQSGYPPAQPPGRRKGRGWIVAVIVVLLGCCLISSVVGGIAIFQANRKSKVEAALKAADTQFEGAGKTVVSVQEVTKQFDTNSGDVGQKTQKAAADATKKIDQAAAQVKKSREAIAPIADTEVGKAYGTAVTEFEAAIETLRTELGYLGKIGGQASVWVQALDLYKKGFTARNDAVTSANSQSWDKAAAKANEASSLFKRAQDLFNKANAVDPAAGLDAAAKYSAKRKDEADLVKQMIADGRANRTTAYNASVTRLNALSREIDKMKEPTIFSDPKWLDKRTAKFTTEFTTHLDKAEAAFNEAHKLFQEGKY